MDVILAVVCLGILTILLLYAGQRFRIPSIVSFLVIGILAGPYALGIVQDQSTIETIGEIGVILLLFIIGLEFSFDKLLGAWRIVVLGGALQVLTTIVAASALMYLARGLQFQEAVFFGFLVSLSSTAIVMKILQERGDVETVPGRTLLGILIFQDLAIIPMILLTPVMMGSSSLTASSLPYEIGKVLLIFIILIVSARWIVPFALRNVTSLKSRELFIFTIAGICFAVAWLTNMAGLSYSLGAFVAGLIIGESEFSIDAVSNIIPFRDVFAAIFFMSIGMLLDTSVLLSNYEIIVTLIVIIIGVKVLTGSFSALVLGMPVRVAVFVGLALAQIGEFSFVLAKSAVGSKLIGTGPYQFFLAGAIITMAMTPFLMSTAPPLTGLLYRFFPSFCGRHEKVLLETAKQEKLSNHIVIVGYGMTGKSVALAAELSGIPFTAIDLDPEVVEREHVAGNRKNIIFGDAVHREILEHAGIREARALVIVIPEENVVPGIIHLAREISPDLYIIVRTRHVSGVRGLLDVGADEVIPEEFEASVSIFACVLAKYALTGKEIDNLTKRIRAGGYRQFNRATAPGLSAAGQLTDESGGVRIHTVTVAPDSPAAGKTLRELDATARYGVGILAIRRRDATITSLPSELLLEPGDLLVLNATDEAFKKFRVVVLTKSPADEPGPT
nr:cation:proton antiporter [uncultured Methanoregula sp.]